VENEDDELEAILRTFEFPGEDPDAIRAFLAQSGFTDRVMERVAEAHDHLRKAIIWAVFSCINLILLGILGTDHYITGFYFGVEETLAQFFFLFLGISAIGGIFGLILTVDTAWFTRWANRHI